MKLQTVLFQMVVTSCIYVQYCENMVLQTPLIIYTHPVLFDAAAAVYLHLFVMNELLNQSIKQLLCLKTKEAVRTQCDYA
jgi:hypothetical protein